ncbi:MAG: response regulator [Solirubrobacteraceae bacterium]
MLTQQELAATSSLPGVAGDGWEQIRVVVADNHAAMRRSLRLLLEGEADLQVIAEAGDIATVMCQLLHYRPRVLVLDLGMHSGSSSVAIRDLRQQVPGSEIVVLTMEESPAFARRALAAGALGFVLKDRAEPELAYAVRDVDHGREYVSSDVRAGLASLRRGR